MTMQTTTFDGQMAAELGRAAAPQDDYSQYKTIRRNGAVVAFEPVKISMVPTPPASATRSHS
jgi:ribonucleoside-diphosphate reductase alpha chain